MSEEHISCGNKNHLRQVKHASRRHQLLFPITSRQIISFWFSTKFFLDRIYEILCVWKSCLWIWTNMKPQLVGCACNLRLIRSGSKRKWSYIFLNCVDWTWRKTSRWLILWLNFHPFMTPKDFIIDKRNGPKETLKIKRRRYTMKCFNNK